MRTQSTLDALVLELQANLGDELAAAQACGVSLMFVNQWAADDPATAKTLQEAVRVGRQGLVSAAIQRGVHGVDEDILYKGVVVHSKKVYSDSLLGKLLDAHIPEFAKNKDGAGIQVQVNVANLMPRAANYEQWLAMKTQTLEGPKEQSIDAEFTEVPEANPLARIQL